MGVLCGCDMVQIERIAKSLENHGKAFAMHFLSEAEWERSGGKAESVAAVFAAKEAGAKALGCGVGRRGYHFHQIEIDKEQFGRPLIRYHGAMLELARELNVCSASLSLSHDGGLALAFVVLQTKENEFDLA